MLAKVNRLTKNDIERVYKRGRTFRGGFFVMRFLPNNAGHYRFATVIPKKVAPKATQRSRLKRKTFVVLEEIIKGIKIRNYDVILSYKQLPDENDIKPVLTNILARIS